MAENGCVSTLEEQLRADLTAAIKARDETRTAALRMAMTSLSTERTSGKAARTLTDDDVVTVLGREVKKRREAADAFAGAGRTDAAARERAEEVVLAAYLPAALSDDELDALVREAVEAAAASGASGQSAMGTVMKTLAPQVKGRADGADVARRVREALGLA